jgi:hypothetical protein
MHMARDDERYGRRDDDYIRSGRSMSEDEGSWRRNRDTWSSEREDFDRGAREYEPGRYGASSGERGEWSRNRDFGRGDEREYPRQGYSSQGYGQGMGGGYYGQGSQSGGYGGYGGGYGAGRSQGSGWEAWPGNYPTAGAGAYEPWRYGRSSRDWSRENWRGDESQSDRYGRGYGPYPRYGESGQYGSHGFGPQYGGSQYGSQYESQSGGYGSGGVGFGATSDRWSREGRYGEGRFYGRGPRGYQRSDDRIRDDVNDRLTFDPDVDASDIIIEVHDGEVRLEGEVEDRDQKRRAEDLAESVPGVRDVSNHIKVHKRHDRERWTAAGTTGSSMTGSGHGSSAGGSPYGATTGNLQNQMRTGMEVCDADGNRLGQVKEMRGSEFLLDRPMARDVYVPFHAVREVRGDRVMLRQREHEIGDQNWESPALMGGGNKGEH